ncbi:MAG: GNAT family N-acetyltransferase [Candidatus Kariarchaeaceae archaeon]
MNQSTSMAIGVSDLSDTVIRHATFDDLEKILLLNIHEYWEDIQTWQELDMIQRWNKGSWWTDKQTLAWHWEILQRCGGGILLVCKDDKVIAHLDFVQSHDYIDDRKILRYHIIWLLVEKKFRRKGIAKSLIRKLAMISKGHEIWVEAEDIRSDALYAKIGTITRFISNWTCSKISSTEIMIPESSVIEFTDPELLFSYIADRWNIVVGRYYAPSFDLAQIIWSDPVHAMIWGNTEGAYWLEYRLDHTHALALVSQYPRILVNGSFDLGEINSIIHHLTKRIIATGYESVFIQIYASNTLHEMLVDVGYVQQGELDPIYCLK